MKSSRFSRYNNLQKTLSICVLLFFIAKTTTSTAQNNNKTALASKPNIIVILTDDMGLSDIDTYGGHFVPTPNIDRLAKAGMKLDQYYSAAPVCSPSRVGILTGMHPSKWKITNYLAAKAHNKRAEQADFLDPGAPTITRFFKNAGYVTGHFGKWHMGGGRDVKNAPNFDLYGIDEHASTYESPDPDPIITATDWIWSDKDSVKRWDRTKYFVDKTLAFMKKNKGKPCFVNLWPDDVHTPWVPLPEGNAKGKFPANAEQEETFKLVLKEYDVQIGRLLDGLKEMGMDKNTIVIFTSDNGPLPSFRGSRSAGLRGTKLSLYEGGIRMPFLISWPGHIPVGKVDSKSEINALDLLPTLAKMANVPLPGNYIGDGIDRSKVFFGKPSSRNKTMFWEYGRNTAGFNYPPGNNKSPNLALRSDKWKLLMNNDGTEVELYDIINDKNETSNLASQEKKTTDKLKQQLAQWWSKVPKP
jgi:arylsulfatase A-like enzyme